MKDQTKQFKRALLNTRDFLQAERPPKIQSKSRVLMYTMMRDEIQAFYFKNWSERLAQAKTKAARRICREALEEIKAYGERTLVIKKEWSKFEKMD